MKKLYWIIGIGVTILLVIIFMKVSEGTKPFEVTLDKAELRSVVEIVSATGKIQPETELKITSDVSGEITEMLVKEGDQIKKGTLICRIQPDLYESALDRVNASVSTTKANLKSAEAQLEQAKASLVNMDANFKRNKKLFEQGAISQQEFDAAKATLDASQDNNSAQGNYLKAIIATRTDKTDDAINLLKNAIAKDAAYKTKAQKDREFLKLNANQAFLDLIK